MSASEEVAAVGDTQRFECQVVGYPSPTVTWFKDEVDITQDPRYNIHFDQGRGVIALTIKEVLPTDEGCYQCRAQNSEGYATTTAYLVVRVDYGLTRGFKSMLVSEKVSEQETSRVQMTSANKQRIIEEVITNYEETEKEVIEEKLFPPQVTYDRALSDGVQLKAGSTLYIEVGVSGIPFPSVGWKHDDTILKEDARITMEDDPSGYSYLKVKGTTQEDTGTYRVTAENTVGKDEASFNVTIKGAPSAPRNLRVHEVYKDYMVIRWDAPENDGGVPITAYNIEKSLSGGTFLTVNQVLSNEFEFKVTRLYEGSEYHFRVSAENKVGVSPFATTEKPTKARLPFDPPGKPRNLKVTSVDKDSVGLSWEAPESDGGALITSFIVERKDVTRTSSMWAIASTVNGDVRDLVVGKLFTGNCYHFRVFAENRVGPGEPAALEDGIIAKLPYDAPSPPRNIRAIETNVDYITLEWDPPESDGGTPLTLYTIEKRDGKRKEFIYIADLGPECTKFKATRLFEGYEYYFRVFAENIVGPSEACVMEKPARAKLPYDEPYAPRSIRVIDYWTDFVTVQWEAPDNDGGSPVTGYIIEKRDALRQTWIKAGTVGPDIDTFKVMNLFEGTDYVFRVFAENKAGPSMTAAELDKPQRAKMPYDAPLAPQSLVTSDITADCATVTWTPPANDGGAAITRYIIEKRDAMRITWGMCGYTEANINTFKVEGLIGGDNYFFRVAAENKVGCGEYVELLHPITAKLPYEKPGPPSNLCTTAVWSNYITIAWDAPEYDGGAPILGYHIEIRDAMKAEFRDVGKTAANVTEFQVGCLEEGRDYYFRVFACNKAGIGENPCSLKPAVKAQLPYDRPSAPTSLKVVGTGKGTISITWGLPANEGGSAVTSYTIEVCPIRERNNFKPVSTVEAAILDYTITDLIDGADYFIRVRAENAAGLGDEGAETDLPVCAREPRTAPEAPGALTVTSVTSESVTITWSAPLSDGGSKVKAYTIEVREVGMTFTPALEVDGTTLTATLPGLAPEKAYEIQVFAVNSEGLSSPVMLAEPIKTEPAPVTMTPPSAPKGLRVTEVLSDAITITWEAPESDGGSPVTHYVVVIKDVASTKKFRKAGRVDANTMTLTVTEKIQPGHEYNMIVYGENEAGVSNDGAELATPVLVPEPKPVVEEVFEEVVEMVESAPVEAAKTKVVPGTPANARCEAVTSEGMTLIWDAPANDGGAAIIKYTIVMRDVEKKKFKSVGEVDGATTRFTVDKVKAEHEYVLRIYAENEIGLSAECEISEPIKIPAKKTEDIVDAKAPAPEIVSAPEPVAVAEGETIRLTCKVKGDPEPEVTWYKGDKRLKVSKREPRIKIHWDMAQDLNLLVITDACAEDSGEYTVVAENEHGTFRFTVTVLVGKTAGAEIIKTTESKRTVTTVEETVVDGEVIERTIKSATSEGTPEVIVEKAEVTESPLPVHVIQEEGAAPRFEQPPEAMLVDIGEDIQLTCRVTGDPEPEVTWYKDDQVIKSKKGEQRVKVDWDMKQDLNILTIKDATKEDAGKYTVIADNKFGSFKFSVTVLVGKPEGGGTIIKTTESKHAVTVLEETIEDGKVVERTVTEDVSEAEPITTVEKITLAEAAAPVEKEPEGFPPKFVQPPEPVFVEFGETVKLTCKVEGSPKPEVIWYKAMSKIETKDRTEVKYSPEDDIHMLIIIEVTAEDSGEYTVIAENKYGNFKVTVTVVVGHRKGEEIVTKNTQIKDIVKVVEETVAESELVQKVMQKSEDTKSDWISEVVSDSAAHSDTFTTESFDIDIAEDFSTDIAVDGEMVTTERVASTDTEKTQPQHVANTETLSMTTESLAVREKTAIEAQLTSADTSISETFSVIDDAIIVTEKDVINVPFTDTETAISETFSVTSDVLATSTMTAPQTQFTDPETTISETFSATDDAVTATEKDVIIAPFTDTETISETFSVTDDTLVTSTMSATKMQFTDTETAISEIFTVSKDSAAVSKSTAMEAQLVATETTISETQQIEASETFIVTDDEITVEEKPMLEAVVAQSKTKAPASQHIDASETFSMMADTRTVSHEETLTAQDVAQIETELADAHQVERYATFTVTGDAAAVSEETVTGEIVSVTEEKRTDKQQVDTSKTLTLIDDRGEAPKFSQPPQSVFVDFGETITLTCKVTGDPQPTVTWYHLDEELATTTDLRTQVEQAGDTYTLTIKDATNEDAGDYKIKAENIFGIFKFTVPVLVGHPAGAHIVETTRTTKSVHETILDGEVVAREEKEDVQVEKFDEVDSQATVSVASSETSTLKQEVLEEAVTAEMGEAVQPADDKSPKFDVPPKPVSVEEGETIRLTCKVSGAPEPEVCWYKGDAQIKPTKRDTRIQTTWSISDDLNHLVITTARSSDAGEYTARAENSHGQRAVTVSVMVGNTIVEEKQEAIEKTSEVFIQEEENRSEEGMVTAEMATEESETSPAAVTEEVAETIQLQISGVEKTSSEVSVSAVEDATDHASMDVVVEQAITEVSSTVTESEALQTDATSADVSLTMVLTEEKEHDDAEIVMATATQIVSEAITRNETEVITQSEVDVEFQEDAEVPIHIDAGVVINEETAIATQEETKVATQEETILTTQEETQKATQKETEIATQEETKVATQEETNVTIQEEKKLYIQEENDEVAKVATQEETEMVTQEEVKVITQELTEVVTQQEAEVVTEEEVEMTTEAETEVATQEEADAASEEEVEMTIETETEVATQEVAVVVTEQETEPAPQEDAEMATQEEAVVPGAPKTELAPKPVIVDVGETIEIICKFSGDPEPEVTFYKGETLIKNKVTNKRVRVDWDMKTDIYALIIQEATSADAADYVICAENSHGSLRSTVSVVVGHKVAETTAVAVAEQLIISESVPHAMVQEEATSESSSSMVTMSVSQTIETSVMDKVDAPTEGIVRDVTEAVAYLASETLALSGDAAKDVVEEAVENVESAVTETVVLEDIVINELKGSVDTTMTDTSETTDTLDSVITAKDSKKEYALVDGSSVGSPLDSESQSECESEAERDDDGAPTIEEAPEPVTLKLGETICLKCKVTGDPAPDVIWLLDDVELKTQQLDGRLKIERDISQNLYILTIKAATLKDAGEYAVKASNVNGGFTLKVTVVVREGNENIADLAKSETTTSMMETTDESGTTSTVLRRETRTTSAIIDGTEQTMSRSASESISESPSELSKTEDIPIGIPGAPVLELAPEPAFVKVGDTIHLTCSVKGDPAPTLSWWKDHMPVPKNDLRIHQSYDSLTRVCSLAIEKASIIDAGKYSIHAENTKGLIIVTVDVVISDEITEVIIQDLKSESVAHGHTNLTVREASSHQWVETSELSVEEIIARELSGTQTTVTEMMTTDSSQMLGGSAPKLEVPPNPQSLMEGAMLRLTCKVSGNPEPTVSWLKGDQPLDGEMWDQRMTIDFVSSSRMHVLTIHDCCTSDSGDYAVLAQNSYGSVSHKVSVNILSHEEHLMEENITLQETSGLAFANGKVSSKATCFDLPSFDDLHSGLGGGLSTTGNELTETQSVQSICQQTTSGLGCPIIKNAPEPMTVALGETIRLTCCATGDPEPDVTWYKDGKQIKTRLRDKRIRVDWDMKTDEQFLNIHDATEADAGEYKVMAENDKGSTSFTVSVNVGDAGAGTVFEQHAISSSSATFSSMSSSSLLDDPMCLDVGEAMRFSSHFK